MVVLVGYSCNNKPEDNHGRETDFLSLISKFSYLNVVELADFMMHH